MPSIKVLLFELYKIFEISRQEGATGFRILEHSVAIFAEEYAVDNVVEGKIEEAVCKMMGVLLEKDLVSLEVKEEDRRSNYTCTLLWDNVAHVHG